MKGAIPTVFGWSLLDMGARVNTRAAGNKNFDKWLEVMPIFMTDNSDTMRYSFNDRVISKMNDFNRKLV